MPTENRSSNTEMVSVQATIESLEEAYAGDGALDFMNDAAQLLRQFKAISALELQGEPVAPKLKKPRYTPTPCRFGGKDGYYQVGGVLVYDSLAEAQASADRKNAELAQRYYEALEHTDPGEVERLRDGLKWESERAALCLEELQECEAQRDEFYAEITGLRAQLAERDALLRDKSGDLIRMAAHLISAPLVALQDLQDEDKKMTRARVGHAVDVADARLKDAAYELRRIADALSASAEPSAPIAWHVGGNGYDRICFEEPRELPGHPCVQAINDQRQLISLLKRYNLRDEETSAPVERDELHLHLERMIGQAEYMLEIAENSSDHDEDNDGSFDECREYINAARAALERKP